MDPLGTLSESIPITSGRRVGGVEGLRGVAALSVLTGHVMLYMFASPFAGSGLLALLMVALLQGVTLFFVLSGYLLYRPFVANVVAGKGRPKVGAFYVNRLLRIYPGYIVVLLVAALILGAAITAPTSPQAPSPAQDRTGYLTDPLLLVLNLLLLHGYVPAAQGTGLAVSWSLVPELAFYAVLPVLWVLGRTLAGRAAGRGRAVVAMIVPAALLFAVGLIGRTVARNMYLANGVANEEPIRNGSTWASVLAHSLLAVGDLFALGMLVAVITTALTRTAHIRIARGFAWVLLPLGALATFPLRAAYLDGPAWALAFAALLFLVVTPSEGRLHRIVTGTLQSRALEHAGLISYSLYLWHLPVIWTLLRFAPGLKFSSLPELIVAYVVVLAATVALSEITFRFVERPALARKRPMLEPQPGPVRT